MQRVRSLLTWCVAVAAVAIIACGEEGEPTVVCEEAPAEDMNCCDPNAYEAVSVAGLIGDPLRHLERTVRVAGVSTRFDEAGDGCTCVGIQCICAAPLGLQSLVCPSLATIVVSGDYGGQIVECSDGDCYPLMPLQAYTACGLWESAPASAPIETRLRLENYCVYPAN